MMDSVFNYKFEFEGDLINVKDYFNDYGKSLYDIDRCVDEKCKTSTNEKGCEDGNCKNDEFCRSFLGISPDELKELKERTSVNHLSCDGEVPPISHEFYKKFDEDIGKTSLKSEEEEKESSTLLSVKKRLEMAETKSEFPRTFYKYCNYKWCIANEKQTKAKLNYGTFNLSTVIVCVKIYHPFSSCRTKNMKIKLLQEIHVLAEQTLCDLKDKIVCSLDYVGDKDVSNECFLKDVGLTITAKDEYPSSFIFVENVFYNDTRSPQMIDLSKVIREWGSQRNLGPFEVKNMESTKICDLNLKIGRPYVYQHQGNCEHVLVFSDVRFLDLNDPMKVSSYPRVHCTGRMYGRHCMMCSDSYARWLVVGNIRLTHDKTYLCNKCFLSYNYINGQKVGQFKAYQYVDPVALL